MDNLYKVQEEDLEKLKRILTVCFAEDPLYCTLIEDKETRERLLPELFESDLTEFFETCDIYSDSEELNSILVVSDETEHQNPIYHYLAQLRGTIRTDESLIKEDHSLKNILEFRAWQGLSECKLDKSAPSDKKDTYHISGGCTEPSASWSGRTFDEGND